MSTLQFEAVGLLGPEKYDPPPNYTESRPLKRNDNGDSDYQQIPSRLISIFQVIMKSPHAAMAPLKGDLRAALLREPLESHSTIANIAQIISDTCEGVRNESGSCINNQQSTKNVTNAEQMETSAKVHVQHDQDTGVENRSSHTDPITPINTMTLRSKDKNNVTVLDAVKSPASETSELSNCPTSSPYKDAPTKDVPERKKNTFIHQMLHQSTEDFTQEARLIIKRFTSRREPEATHLNLICYLKHAGDIHEKTGTDGSEWLSLVEAGHNDLQLGTIRYAIATMAFTRWHESRVDLQMKQLQPADILKKPFRKRKWPIEEESKEALQKKASHLVTITLIGERPEGNAERSAWEQRRKNIGTYLTRGRKWHRLVQALGFGILFFSLWTLAKTANEMLNIFIDSLLENSDKMAILDRLSSQLIKLLEGGKTDEQDFDKFLQENDYLTVSIEQSLDDELTKFADDVIESSTDEYLFVSGTDHSFSKKSLRVLEPDRWLNDEIVVACLHLSDKLSNMRVGWSVPIHSDLDIVLDQPFEKAAIQVSKWRKELSESELTCFFPLLLHNNHFTLLEINDKEGFIYHYNSLRGSSKDIRDIRKACLKQSAFSHLKFKEQEAIAQNDLSSCGLLTIKHAQSRMLGRSATWYKGTSKSLRHEAISMLKKAWNCDTLVEALAYLPKERNVTQPVEEGSAAEKRKRQRVVIEIE